MYLRSSNSSARLELMLFSFGLKHLIDADSLSASYPNDNYYLDLFKMMNILSVI